MDTARGLASMVLDAHGGDHAAAGNALIAIMRTADPLVLVVAQFLSLALLGALDDVDDPDLCDAVRAVALQATEGAG